MVGPERFELSTFRPPGERANQAALWPDINIKGEIMLDMLNEVNVDFIMFSSILGMVLGIMYFYGI